MTIEYVQDLSTISSAGLFKVLFRWHGSIYKLLWRDFLLFIGMFYTIHLIYELLDPVQQSNFLILSEYCQKFSGIIPVNLVLGFYVNQVIGRFYAQFNMLPWITRLAVFLSMYIQGEDDESRLLRRTIVRYNCLACAITMTSISPNVKKRFPTLGHLTEAGLFTEKEQRIYENIDTIYNKWFVPTIWATGLVSRARQLGKIKDDIYSCCLINEISSFQTKLRTLFCYDWVQLPLVYTQVVTLVVYSYFLACLLGKQDIPNRSVKELPFPLLTFLLFFFYMGWLKVAEEMLNPFGEDDDDFDINSVIDFNLEVGYIIVDMHNQAVDLSRDQFWDNTDATIPYTAAAQKWRKLPYLGTAANLIIPQELQSFISTLPRIPGQVIDTISAHQPASTKGKQEQAAEPNKNSSNDYLINLDEQQTEYDDESDDDDQPEVILTTSSMSMDWPDAEKQGAESEENFTRWRRTSNQCTDCCASDLLF